MEIICYNCEGQKKVPSLTRSGKHKLVRCHVCKGHGTLVVEEKLVDRTKTVKKKKKRKK